MLRRLGPRALPRSRGREGVVAVPIKAAGAPFPSKPPRHRHRYGCHHRGIPLSASLHHLETTSSPLLGLTGANRAAPFPSPAEIPPERLLPQPPPPCFTAQTLRRHLCPVFGPKSSRGDLLVTLLPFPGTPTTGLARVWPDHHRPPLGT
jgi:hypothetical protein